MRILFVLKLFVVSASARGIQCYDPNPDPNIAKSESGSQLSDLELESSLISELETGPAKENRFVIILPE